MARKSRLVSELGDDVFDDTIVEKKHRIDPHKRNYIIGFSSLAVIAVALGMVYYTAVNVWLYDYQNMPYLEYSVNEHPDEGGIFDGQVTASITRLKSNTNYPSDFKVPKTINGYPITRIENQAFAGCDRLTNVYMADNIISLGDEVFLHCEKLKSIRFSKNLYSIGNNCFEDTAFQNTWSNFDYYNVNGVLLYLNHTKLLNEYHKEKFAFVANSNSFYINDFDSDTLVFCLETLAVAGDESNKNIHINQWMDGIFANIDSLIFAETPAYLSYITDHAFENCQNLEEVSIGSRCTDIGNYAFNNCSSLTDITIPTMVSSINNYAFANTKISISSLHEDLVHLGEGAFANCESITSMSVPSTLTEIPSYAFYKTSLSSINFVNSDNITSIGSSAFANTLLSTFAFPKNVELISQNVFANCANLTEISMYNEGPTRLYGSAFYNDTNLKTIKLLNADGSVLIQEEGTANMPLSLSSTTGKDGVEGAGHVFENCAFEKVVFNVNVSNISEAMFKGCSNLKEVRWVDISHTVCRVIGASAFENCEALEQFVCPNLVRTIGLYCFRNCSSLVSCHLPEAKEWTTFEQNYATNYGTTTAYYISTINQYVFSGCSSLDSITIPSTISKISSYAFENCNSLNIVFIPSTVTSIGADAFAGNPNLYLCLETQILPDSSRFSPGWDNGIKGYVLSSREIFRSGNFVVSLNTDGETLTIIDLIDSSSLVDLVIPQTIDGRTVTGINDNFVNSSSTLQTVTIPDTITSIGEHTFENCPLLTVTTENGFSYIGNSTNKYHAIIRSVEVEEGERYLINENTKVIVRSSLNNPNIEFTTDFEENDSVAARYIGTATNNYFVLVEATAKSNEFRVKADTKIIASNAFVTIASKSIIVPNTVDYVMKDAVKGNIFFNLYCEDESKPDGWDYGWNASPEKNAYYWGSTGPCTDSSYKGCLNLDGTARLVSYSGIYTTIHIPTQMKPSDSETNYNVTEIASGCFTNNNDITGIFIPQTITKVGASAFENVPNAKLYLESSSVPSSWSSEWNISNLPTYFGINDTNHLEKDGIHYVVEGSSAIITGYEYGLTDHFEIPSSITIGASSYPVTKIGRNAFSGSELTSVSIPSSVTTIEEGAFKNCGSLVIYFSGASIPSSFDEEWNPNNRPVYLGINADDILISDNIEFIVNPQDNNSAIVSGHLDADETTIPNTVVIKGRTLSVKSIGKNAFENSNIVYARFSESTNITRIEDRAFAGCKELIYFIVPAGVTYVGEYIFFGANNTLTVYIVEDVIPDTWDSNWGIIAEYEDTYDEVFRYLGLETGWKYGTGNVPVPIIDDYGDEE